MKSKDEMISFLVHNDWTKMKSGWVMKRWMYNPKINLELASLTLEQAYNVCKILQKELENK